MWNRWSVGPRPLLFLVNPEVNPAPGLSLVDWYHWNKPIRIPSDRSKEKESNQIDT